MKRFLENFFTKKRTFCRAHQSGASGFDQLSLKKFQTILLATTKIALKILLNKSCEVEFGFGWNTLLVRIIALWAPTKKESHAELVSASVHDNEIPKQVTE